MNRFALALAACLASGSAWAQGSVTGPNLVAITGSLVSTDKALVIQGIRGPLLATMTQLAAALQPLLSFVSSFNTRTGAITLTSGDVLAALGYTPYSAANPSGYQTAANVTSALSGYAPLASPTFTGIPAVPTATAGTNTTQAASTAFVIAAVTAATTGVSSFNTRTGAITLSSSDVTTALGFTPYNSTNPSGYQTAANVTSSLASYAPLASPALTGTPTVPTAAGGTNTTQAASTAFVLSTVGGYAPLASPTFTGTPAAPTATAGTSTTQIATTAFVTGGIATETSRATTAEGLLAPKASPTFTGTVTIPSGASISGFAPLASPALTGTPTVPTATAGTNTTQAASTAFVLSTVGGYAPLASPTFTGTVTIPTGASIAGYLTSATAASTYAPIANPIFTTGAAISASGGLTWQATNTAATTDQKISDIYMDGSSTSFRFLNDAHSAANNWISATRSGYVASSVSITATNFTITDTATTNTGTLLTGAITTSTINATGDNGGGNSALTSGTTVATGCAAGNLFTLTLATNATLSNPTGCLAGHTYSWVITQDGTGSRTMAYGTAFKFAAPYSAASPPILSTAAGAVDMLSCLYNGTNMLCSFGKAVAANDNFMTQWRDVG